MFKKIKNIKEDLKDEMINLKSTINSKLIYEENKQNYNNNNNINN